MLILSIRLDHFNQERTGHNTGAILHPPILHILRGFSSTAAWPLLDSASREDLLDRNQLKLCPVSNYLLANKTLKG